MTTALRHLAASNDTAIVVRLSTQLYKCCLYNGETLICMQVVSLWQMWHS